MIDETYLRDLLREVRDSGGYQGIGSDHLARAMGAFQADTNAGDDSGSKFRYHVESALKTGLLSSETGGTHWGLSESADGHLAISRKKLWLSPQGDQVLRHLETPEGIETLRQGIANASAQAGSEALRQGVAYLVRFLGG